MSNNNRKLQVTGSVDAFTTNGIALEYKTAQLPMVADKEGNRASRRKEAREKRRLLRIVAKTQRKLKHAESVRSKNVARAMEAGKP